MAIPTYRWHRHWRKERQPEAATNGRLLSEKYIQKHSSGKYPFTFLLFLDSMFLVDFSLVRVQKSKWQISLHNFLSERPIASKLP